VYDLERPERFLRIVFRPQWKSWLVRGAFLLIGFSTVTGLWWLLETGAYLGWWSDSLPEGMRSLLLWITVPLAVGAAIYTAFLFGQAEGRDLWQSTLLPVHLIVQAFMMGAAMMLIIMAFVEVPEDLQMLSKVTFVVALVLDLVVTLLGEFGMPHASEVAARAAHMITHGYYRRHFWIGNILVGHVLPLALLLFSGTPAMLAIAGILSIIGLYLYEYAFVMAPQRIPNS